MPVGEAAPANTLVDVKEISHIYQYMRVSSARTGENITNKIWKITDGAEIKCIEDDKICFLINTTDDYEL